MTDRKQALTDLLEDIESGTWPGNTYYLLGASGHWSAFRAFEYGSLDAAKALRVAVLPWPVPETICSDSREELMRILKELIALEQA